MANMLRRCVLGTVVLLFSLNAITRAQVVSSTTPTNDYYGFLQAGHHHDITIRMGGASSSQVSYTVLRNTFVLSSPDGAHWDNLVITPLVSVGDSGFPYTSYSVGLISGGGTPHGSGADTIRLTAIVPPGNCFTGLQSRTAFNFLRISFDSRSAEAGDTIFLSRPGVIDSSSWQWTEDTLCGGTITIPAFVTGVYPLSVKDCFLRGDVDGDGTPYDIGDLTRLIDYLFISGLAAHIPFPKQADMDPDGSIDISDLTKIVDVLFITFELPPPCP